ncbi:hypothetical protein J6590_081708, partial [Homalodisca vitripennis]
VYLNKVLISVLKFSDVGAHVPAVWKYWRGEVSKVSARGGVYVRGLRRERTSELPEGRSSVGLSLVMVVTRGVHGFGSVVV